MLIKMKLLTDTHSHLELFKDDLDEVLENAKKAGFKAVITAGINPETNRKALKLAKKYDIIQCSLGVYPRSALKRETKDGEFPLKLEEFDVLKEIDFIKANKDNIVAIGEIGLDFVNGRDEGQIEDFKEMLKLAEELKKPVIVHSRKAEEECIEILESFKLKKVIMHCFCGKKKLVKRIQENGWYFSIPAIVVRTQQFQELVKEVPLSQLFTESDAPYLSPYKDKRNEPAFITETIKKIAEIKRMDEQEVVNNIYMNFGRVF
jgi:TatD DNase family protein|tara:strand:- start:1280 stop:2065 length:786 start_codon:yes stop_codon:yes gene_type:complete